MSATPLPPYLVIASETAFWIETTPPDHASATLQAFKRGCFLNGVCYDASGRLWPIVTARLKASPTLWQRCFPWRLAAVELELGTPQHVAMPEIVSRLREVLLSGNDFCEHALEDPTLLVHSLEAARTPQHLIEIVQSGLPRVRPFGSPMGE